jgi:hypothetical protein
MHVLRRALRGARIPLALTVLVAAAAPQFAGADLIYQPYGHWNGKKIYLSPARHEDAGHRGECGTLTENQLAYYEAVDAATGSYYRGRYRPSSPFRNLRARGYKIRIGTGTLRSAIRNSNAWGATRHIPIHSNADVANQCGRTDRTRFGTLGIYRVGSTRGKDLATKLVRVLGVEPRTPYTRDRPSPGTNDHTCFNPGDPCTTIDLGELREVNAPAAYMEMEFHTWNTGYNWLFEDWYWAWRFGRAIDLHLGYPR